VEGRGEQRKVGGGGYQKKVLAEKRRHNRFKSFISIRKERKGEA